jgi:trehalose-6-phosphatase
MSASDHLHPTQYGTDAVQERLNRQKDSDAFKERLRNTPGLTDEDRRYSLKLHTREMGHEERKQEQRAITRLDYPDPAWRP